MMFIGGGGGLSYILDIVGDKPENNIVVSTFDTGGDSGKLRRKYGGISVGDIKQVVKALKKIDFEFYTKIGGHKFWNQTIFELINEYGVMDGINLIRKTLGIKSKIYPVTVVESNLYAKTTEGIIVGEYNIENANSRIMEVWLNPKVEVNNEIPIENCVVVTPGSIYGSLISNLLVEGFIDKIKDAYKVLIVNGKRDGETIWMKTLDDYINEFKKYGFNPDLIVAPKDGDFEGKPDISLNSNKGIYDPSAMKNFFGDLYENCNRF